MLVVALGAILIALGAFAVNDPRAVLNYFSRWRRNLSFSISENQVRENQVRYVGVAIILIAIIWIVVMLAILPRAGVLGVMGDQPIARTGLGTR